MLRTSLEDRSDASSGPKPRTRYIAGVSLAIMAGGFLLTLPFDTVPWVRFLRSGFEAGLVGGLADWFAVTALFRHPLGLPIPHTAILPSNRRRVTKALVSVVENDLLSKASIRDKLARFPITERALDGLAAGLRTEEAAGLIVAASEFALQSVPWERIAAALERELRSRLDALDAAEWISRVAEYGFLRQWDGKALDFALDFAEEFINRESTVLQMGAMASEALGRVKTSGLMSFALNAFAGFMSEERLGETIRQWLQGQIDELRYEHNPTRLSILAAIRTKLKNALTREETRNALDEWKRALLSRFDWSGELETLVARIRTRLEEAIRSEGYAETIVVPVLEKAIRRLQDDAGRTAQIESYVQDKLAGWIESNHHRIGKLIEENIDKYDNETLIAMLESKIGGDLQWIRVNGAICGFLIGLLLAVIHLLLP